MSDFNERTLSARWTAVVNDEIGGWAVTIDGRTRADGGVMAVDMVTREVAEHIANLHNAAIDDSDVHAVNLRLRRELAQALLDRQNAINAAETHAGVAGHLYRQFVEPGPAQP